MADDVGRVAELINSGTLSTTGPAIGEPVPDFELSDQFGNVVRLSEAKGAGKALILFHRSASR